MRRILIKPVYIIGDIHGEYAKLLALLRGAGLVDETLAWAGGDSRLWFMGDFFDRGSEGLRAVELVMRLQKSAPDAGGEVRAILGNHEVLFLSAYQFGGMQGHSPFVQAWLRNGGSVNDMNNVTGEHLVWLKRLPAMALVQDRLLIHADAIFYARYGSSIKGVNEQIGGILQGKDTRAWHQLLDSFSERMTYFNPRANGAGKARQMLEMFGGRQIIHGHTPIHYMEPDWKPHEVREPLSYANNLCINVDGGMYSGGSGFIYRLPS